MDARTQFDRQASHYNQQWADWNRGSLEWMLARSQAGPHHRLLDVATGSGYTALGFASLVRQAIGVDVSEGMLAQAQTRGVANVSFVAGAAALLPFPRATFDLVTCRIAPHHFPSVPDFLAEAWRVLAPGGRILIADTTVSVDVAEWQNGVERLRDPSHVRNLTPEEWESFARAAGFDIEELAVLESPNEVSLNDWLEKAGSAGAAAATVRAMFGAAPEEAVRRFQIEAVSGGDYRFAWQRVALVAHKA